MKPTTTQNATVVLSREAIDQIDALAEQQHRSRSSQIAFMLDESLSAAKAKQPKRRTGQEAA